MMDVSLINDGPVGVDYRCEDEAVYLFSFPPAPHLDGILIVSLQVTIEINTDPPKMDDPTSFEAPTEGDTFKGKVQKQFTLPASLLE